jgi:hypothetical protein
VKLDHALGYKQTHAKVPPESILVGTFDSIEPSPELYNLSHPVQMYRTKLIMTQVVIHSDQQSHPLYQDVVRLLPSQAAVQIQQDLILVFPVTS